MTFSKTKNRVSAYIDTQMKAKGEALAQVEQRSLSSLLASLLSRAIAEAEGKGINLQIVEHHASVDSRGKTVAESTVDLGQVQFDCTQRQLVVDIATTIYPLIGGSIENESVMRLFESQNPRKHEVLAIAEQIYELFAGDSPDYGDEE